ncbi:quinone-dependent dihydroorotate dehydrogenase [Pelagibacteraceae bacterium]|nr:quinone-dependent dihydroorotate dehydrogenase [Pelagibacteraceae bacterium]
MYNSSLKILRLLPPEISHTVTINFLKYFKVRQKNIEDSILSQHLMGLDFPNPIGLAAGFDKNAEVMHSMFSFGFGFIEVGTITPQPQIGNSKPRVFRLSEDKAIINRLGFNNKGIKKVKKNLIKHQKSYLNNKILGINIGKNKNSKDAIDDYLTGLEELGDLASYITINISSPNTEGLRDLQLRGKIEKLIKKIIDKRDEIKNFNTKPILIKISPDLNDDQLRDLALISLANNIDGLILTNSTIKRESNLISLNKEKKGGLSGRPLYDNSNLVLKKMYELTNGQIPLIGVGGISSGRDCYEKIKSGASLVQLYTALVYSGPNLINSMKGELIDLIKTDGYKNISEVIGKSV